MAWQSRLMLWALVGASLCVLLIACTNLANLMLSRALARRTEFAVRAAVGASLDRLVRQMLTDSLLLAGAGGLLGVMLAVAAAPLVVRLVPTALPIAELPPIDLRMLGLAAFITLATGIAFGVLPALRVCRKTDGSALKEGARGGTSAGTERLRVGARGRGNRCVRRVARVGRAADSGAHECPAPSTRGSGVKTS